MSPDLLPPSAPWRQSIAGWLLIMGGLVSIGALFLPWVTGAVPASYQCSDCKPMPVSPGQDLLHYAGELIHEPSAGGMPLFWGVLFYLLISFVLPLALATIGLRLLRRSPVTWNVVVWHWGKALTIVVGVLYVVAVQALLQISGLHFIMTGFHLSFDIGYLLATLMSLLLLIASFMIPIRLKRG